MTLADLLARTRACGDCMEWTGPVHRGRANAPLFTRKNQKVYARREVAHLSGKLIAGRCVTTACRNPLCVNPDHLRVVSRAVIQRRTAASGAWTGIHIKMKVAAAKRAVSKLSQEDVRAIRMSAVPVPELAQHYGISEAYTYMILRHQSRIEYETPFVGLLVGVRA